MSGLSRLTDFLATYLTPGRHEKIIRILDERTRFLTVVLEDIYDSMNASAVVRSAEALGIQDIHVIENRNKFEIRAKVTTGTFKWINLYRYNDPSKNNTPVCLNSLKDQGYEIWATTPHEPCESLDDIQMRGKTALLLGSEHLGLSAEALALADRRVKIPMRGFAESFNISVSAGISIYTIFNKMRAAGFNYHLTSEEKEELRYQWVRKTLRRADLIEKRFIP